MQILIALRRFQRIHAGKAVAARARVDAALDRYRRPRFGNGRDADPRIRVRNAGLGIRRSQLQPLAANALSLREHQSGEGEQSRDEGAEELQNLRAPDYNCRYRHYSSPSLESVPQCFTRSVPHLTVSGQLASVTARAW